MPATDSLIGRRLGVYQIESRIGAGGMATVYQARDLNMQRAVAIKVLPQHFAEKGSYAERFLVEARSAARLDHPHILPVYAFGDEEGITYMVMRLVRGGTLSDWISRGPLDFETASLILRQIASALDYAHARGILHRDVKPSNILLDEAGHSYLSDFGIAKVAETSQHLTATGSLIGTPSYMSPEQCRGAKQLSPASDQYSLGVMLYEMLTGQVPFHDDLMLAVIQMHLFEEPVAPTALRPDLPSAAEAVILTALAKQPERCYPDCSSFSAAFDAALLAAPWGAPAFEAPATLIEPPPYEGTGVETWGVEEVGERAAPQTFTAEEAPAPETLPAYAEAVAPPLAVEAPPLTDTRQITEEWEPPLRPRLEPAPAARPAPRRRGRAWIGVVAALLLLGLGAGAWIASGGLRQPATRVTEAPTQIAAQASTETPSPLPTEPLAPPEASPSAAPGIVYTGGGTGWIGYNSGGRAYLVDAACLFSEDSSCSREPVELPEVDGVRPNFGAWSPDGEWFAFLDLSGVEMGAAINQTGYYSMRADGSEMMQIGGSGFIHNLYQTEGVSRSRTVLEPVWAGPDQVFFVSGPDMLGADLSTPLTVHRVSPSCVREGDTDCGMVLGFSGAYFSVRPNAEGSRIAVERRSIEPGVGNVVRLSVIDTATLANDEFALSVGLGAGAHDAAWRPDGTLLYGLHLSDQQDVLIYDPATGLETTLYSFTPTGWPAFSELALSPDGRYVALTVAGAILETETRTGQQGDYTIIKRQDDSEIGVLDIECALAGRDDCFQIITDNEEQDAHPAWSPDGSLLSFVAGVSPESPLGTLVIARFAPGDGGLVVAEVRSFPDIQIDSTNIIAPPQWQPGLR